MTMVPVIITLLLDTELLKMELKNSLNYQKKSIIGMLSIQSYQVKKHHMSMICFGGNIFFIIMILVIHC